jgi:hypothetical protein
LFIPVRGAVPSNVFSCLTVKTERLIKRVQSGLTGFMGKMHERHFDGRIS